MHFINSVGAMAPPVPTPMVNYKANNYKFLVSRPGQRKKTMRAGGYYLLFY